MIAMTARQRGSLARLRINHPRATVAVSHITCQKRRPEVRLRMSWPRYYSRVVWVKPDGEIVFEDTKINWHDKVRR